MVPSMAFRHLREAGHKGISLLGGGTARIGDPSDKTETRKMLSYEELDKNTESIKTQEGYAISLQNTQIECYATLKIIRNRDSKDAFFYCDPSYVGADHGHYDGYTQEDFESC
jgi:tyrosyl-tRNA synthetase